MSARAESCIAIIPARGGSKRIPRKNIKAFCGQPIIKYSIDAALRAGCFDEVMVSTDDQEIADVARSCKAAVPFLRSAATANDHAILIDVLTEVLQEYAKQGRTFTHYFCILPTAPTISPERIKAALALMESCECDSVIPVVKFSYPIQRAFKIDEDGTLKMMWPENLKTRSQDLPAAYQDAGQFYCGTTEALLTKKMILTENTAPLSIPEHETQDIDNDDDWRMAELKFRLLKELNNA